MTRIGDYSDYDDRIAGAEFKLFLPVQSVSLGCGTGAVRHLGMIVKSSN